MNQQDPISEYSKKQQLESLGETSIMQFLLQDTQQSYDK